MRRRGDDEPRNRRDSRDRGESQSYPDSRERERDSRRSNDYRRTGQSWEQSERSSSERNGGRRLRDSRKQLELDFEKAVQARVEEKRRESNAVGNVRRYAMPELRAGPSLEQYIDQKQKSLEYQAENAELSRYRREKQMKEDMLYRARESSDEVNYQEALDRRRYSQMHTRTSFQYPLRKPPPVQHSTLPVDEGSMLGLSGSQRWRQRMEAQLASLQKENARLKIVEDEKEELVDEVRALRTELQKLQDRYDTDVLRKPRARPKKKNGWQVTAAVPRTNLRAR